jgi:hypothetical protein
MQGKKSFVLYTDIIHTVKILTDEEAGILFKHILNYVNDLNPVLEDRLLQATFEPIKQQLKRDLVKYEKRVQVAKSNGEKGGRPKKVETKKTEGVKKEAKKTVNDNGNVIVTENGNENENVIDLPFKTERFFKAWGLWKHYKTKQFKFTFKSEISETTALSKLVNLSGNDENTALLILEQSVANGWKGIFALPEEKKQGKNLKPSDDYLENLKKRLA